MSALRDDDPGSVGESPSHRGGRCLADATAPSGRGGDSQQTGAHDRHPHPIPPSHGDACWSGPCWTLGLMFQSRDPTCRVSLCLGTGAGVARVGAANWTSDRGDFRSHKSSWQRLTPEGTASMRHSWDVEGEPRVAVTCDLAACVTPWTTLLVFAQIPGQILP